MTNQYIEIIEALDQSIIALTKARALITESVKIEPLLTVRDVAKTLRSSSQTVYDLVKTKKLPAVRVKSSVRFTKSALTNFISTDNPSGARVGNIDTEEAIGNHFEN